MKVASAALLMGIYGGAAAQAEGEFSGNIALSTDYVYRGVTQTDGAPGVSGGFDWASDDFYVGTWASNVDFGDGTSTEIDFYGGWTPTVGAVGLDIGVIYYAYPDAPDMPEQNFVELYAGGSIPVGDKIELGASYAYSPEFYAESGAAGYTSLSAGYAVNDTIGVDASVGFQDFYDEGNDSYSDYSLGLTVAVPDYVDLDFRFIDTAGLDGNEESFVITVSRGL